MIKGQTVLAVIPARGGSKGVLRKNLREVGGKPLLAWTIEEAKKSGYIDRLILSSDDSEIIETARKFGCEVPFVRPAALARDESPGIDPVLHALEAVPAYDYIVLLQPTSPLRSVNDIDACIASCVEQKAESCVSVTEVTESPFWMYSIDAQGRLKPLIENQYERRQDQPRLQLINGAIYVARCSWLKEKRSFVGENTVAYPMPRERSLDIDTEADLREVTAILKRGNADDGKI